jgi:hypothetical protein
MVYGLNEVSVTAVLNVYKRGANLQKQLDALQSQSHPVKEILVWENGQDRAQQSVERFIRVRSDMNMGVWARFALALNANSEFVWILDDDSIPGRDYLANCVQSFKAQEGVYGSRGLIFRTTKAYNLYDEVGTHNPNKDLTQVDLVGHNWFFPKAWLAAFWGELPNRFESPFAGEDMHLSYSVQKILGKATFVPPQPPNDFELWGEKPYATKLDGTDSAALSRQPGSLQKFERAFSHYVRQGWSLLASDHEGSTPFTTRVLARAMSSNPGLVHTLGRLKKFIRRTPID